MSDVDPVRLSKTMSFLLRHRPEVGNLTLDEAGWVALPDLCSALSRLLRTDVEADMIEQLVSRSGVRRFEIRDGRIRALHRALGSRRAGPPDIVYHATTEEGVQRYLEHQAVALPDRPILLSTDESQAWRAAHRLGLRPRVLCIDTTRARRHGVRFQRNRRNGLYAVEALALTDALNLLPNYAEQISAGGIPVGHGPDGRARMALIRVARRSGVTWEVAKGKLEEGEPPERAAVREVREEMGLEVELTLRCFVGHVRYGFMAPGGLPRLKTVHLYLLDLPDPAAVSFHPAEEEGIGAARWFTPEEACRAVTHSSLIPLMHRARQLIERLGR